MKAKKQTKKENKNPTKGTCVLFYFFKCYQLSGKYLLYSENQLTCKVSAE